jgi:hypothetical protein
VRLVARPRAASLHLFDEVLPHGRAGAPRESAARPDTERTARVGVCLGRWGRWRSSAHYVGEGTRRWNGVSDGGACGGLPGPRQTRRRKQIDWVFLGFQRRRAGEETVFYFYLF